MDNTVAYDMYSNEIISLLELRHKIYNRIVVAVNIRDKIWRDINLAETDDTVAKSWLKDAVDGQNQDDIKRRKRKLNEAELTLEQLKAFYDKIEGVIENSVIDYDWVSTKLSEVMRGLRSYDGNMVLHNMWKSGSDVDNKLTTLGREAHNSKSLAEYSDMFSIEMAAIFGAPTHSVQDLLSDMITDGDKDRALRLMQDSDNGGGFDD